MAVPHFENSCITLYQPKVHLAEFKQLPQRHLQGAIKKFSA